jgi:alpha-tubulin suppressor-like RCC1 family protein
MKTIRSDLRNLAIICGLITLFSYAHAQETAPSNQSIQAASDLDLMLQALEQTTPLPATETPDSGTFYTVQHMDDWPPLPGNTMDLPFWSIGDGYYVLDDRNVDYAELQAEAEAAAMAAKLISNSPSDSGMAPMFSLIGSSGSAPVYLTNLLATSTNGSITVTFTIAGGTNGFAYDIYSTTNPANSPVYSQWTWLGQGYTTNSYTFTNQPVDQAFYILAMPRQTMVVAWGDDWNGVCDVPSGLTNAIDVAGGYNFSLALKSDGTVIAWGDNTFGETNVPAGLTNVTSIAAGGAHVLALLQNGTVIAWGDNANGQTNVPTGLANVTAIAAGDACSLALRNDGTVVAWGYNYYGQTNVPALGPGTQIAAGVVQSVVLLTNNSVAMWAKYNYSVAPCGWGITNVPAGLSNIVSIAAGAFHTLALKANGTVAAWGAGGTNSGLDNYGQSIVPAGLSNVVAVAGGYLYSMALHSDGTVVAWGDDYYEETDLPAGLTGVKAISAGGFHGLAVRSGLLTPVILKEPDSQYALAGDTVTFSSLGEGFAGVTYQWQFNGMNITGGTNASLTLTSVQTTNEGSYQVIISNSGGMGSIVGSNVNFYLVTPPTIVSQAPLPTNQVVIFHTNLTLSITATAPGQFNGFPLGYQWQFDGMDLAGANSNSYSLLAETTTSGTYSVIVTNAAGSVTSFVWQVTMTYVGSYIDFGTLAYHLSTNAVGRTNGFTGNYNDMLEFISPASTNLDRLTNAAWSTNFWLTGVQGLSATPIGFSNVLGGQGLPTMVSPRHYLCATHMHPEGFLMAFLDTNNVIYWRTTLQRVDITNTSAPDTSVGILNADLPESVNFLPVVPKNLSNYLPTNFISYVQGVGMNQDMRLFSQPMAFPIPNIFWNSAGVIPFGLTINWGVNLRSGDSSAPEMLLINNQLVLASHNFFGYNGPNYAFQIDAINQEMHYLSTNNNVGTDYQLTLFQLTNWPNIQ